MALTGSAPAQIFVGKFNGGIDVYTNSGTPLTSLSAAGVMLGIASDGNGNLFVACGHGRGPGTDTIRQLTTDGTSINDSLITSINCTFGGVAVVGTNLYVMDSGTVAHYSTSGALLNPSLIASGAGSLVYDGYGHLYVARPGDNAIGKYKITGEAIDQSFITGLHGTNGSPFGFAADGNGHLFVASPGDGTISEYSTSGQLLNPALVTGLGYTTALALDADTNLFVVDNSAQIVGEYSCTGATVNSTLVTGSPTPSFVLVLPLPVPGPPEFTSFQPLNDVTFQFAFTGSDGTNTNFTMLASASLQAPLTNWTALSNVTPTSPGLFQFFDSAATNSSHRFYRLRWP